MGMGQLELKLAAVERYMASARRAEINDYWARLTRTNCSLIKYEDVASRLHIRQQIPAGHQMVLLNNIVGSVGRYREYTRGFYPRRAVLQDRWVMVDVTLNSMRGLPPVELYKVGEAYFVIDGNHRISVARANENKDIEAVVIECQTNVPLTVEDFTTGKWLIKAAYNDFMAQTKLDQLRPAAHWHVSHAEHYETLLQHIAVHRYLTNNQVRVGDALSWEEAVLSWHDTVYMPVLEAIRAQGLTSRFKQRTETDLYIAITQYRERVAEQFELAPLTAETATAIFAANHHGHALPVLLHRVREQVASRLRLGVTARKMPVGMTPEEFATLRLRHDAGELSVAEAGRKQRQEGLFQDALCEGNFSPQFSG